MNFTLKRHKKFTDNLAKQNLRSRENEGFRVKISSINRAQAICTLVLAERI